MGTAGEREVGRSLEASIRRYDEPVGAMRWASTLFAVLAIAALSWCYGQHQAVRAGLTALLDKGEVARLAPTASTARSIESASVRVQAAASRALAASPSLVAAGTPPRADGLAAAITCLEAWRELRVAWAEALREEGVTIADYRAAVARLEPRPVDRWLAAPG